MIGGRSPARTGETGVKKKQQSGKKLLLRIFCIMLSITLACVVICGVYSVSVANRELKYCNEAALDIFYDGLQYTMQDLQKFNQDIFDNDSPFRLLNLGNGIISVSQRLQAEQTLRQLCKTRIDYPTGIYLFQGEQGFSYYAMGLSFLGGQINADIARCMTQLRRFLLEGEETLFSRWLVFSSGEYTLLVNASRRGDLYSCAMVDIAAYSQAQEKDLSSIEYCFVTRDRILTNQAYAAERGITLGQMLEAAEGESVHGLKEVLYTRFLEELGVGLCGIISISGAWKGYRGFWMLFLAAFLAIGSLFLVTYSFMKRILIYPLDQISRVSRQIASGENEIPRNTESLEEFNAIQDALSRLVEQKVVLEREKLSQAYEKEHALLQYYQLQTRSHFFLNCLKSIYNLAAQGQMEKTLRITTLFSNHLRYVFHDSLSLVRVEEELEEVHDYFHIIELERSDHILLQENVEPELMDFQVPPLIVQTFLENFNKHNAQGDRILKFTIRMDRVNLEGERYVRLRLSDNGVGYSEEALKTMENPDGVFAQYHVGIQNLFRRMDILYRGRYKSAFFNNPSGGATSVLYLPEAPAGDHKEKQS